MGLVKLPNSVANRSVVTRTKHPTLNLSNAAAVALDELLARQSDVAG